MPNAYLHLSNDQCFHGVVDSPIETPVQGEVVFTTGMVGYIESMTDPSYTGQILVFTYPLIGNYGVDQNDLWESDNVHVRAIVVSSMITCHMPPQAQDDLKHFCQQHNIPILMDVDTRALTRAIRSEGVLAGEISQTTTAPTNFEDINTQHLVKQVSRKNRDTIRKGKKKIIAIDCGMKHNITRHLAKQDITLELVPFNTDFTQENFDGVFISNGPGDPATCTETIAIIQQVMNMGKPIFGICLGSQLMALAAGATTYKLPFGHRGQNQPVQDTRSKRCYLTSQNHGYAVDANTLPADWEVYFTHLNDNTVSGIKHKTQPYFAVQFHPEAAPGPVDTAWLFDEFMAALS